MVVTVVLSIAALVTATISGIIGMGGGILLLATLFCFLPHGEAIPTHAIVQLSSNTTRVLGLVRHVDWRSVGRFAMGAFPGAVLGAALLWSLGDPGEKEPYLKLVVGAYILLIPLVPKPSESTTGSRLYDFPLMGFLAGAAGLTVGAVGPLIAPLFARRGYVKERLVSTKAMCQATVHVMKIPAFLYLRTIDYEKLGMLALLMCLMVIPGTLLGRRILKHVTSTQFVLLYRIALAVAGLKVFFVDGVWKLL